MPVEEVDTRRTNVGESGEGDLAESVRAGKLTATDTGTVTEKSVAGIVHGAAALTSREHRRLPIGGKGPDAGHGTGAEGNGQPAKGVLGRSLRNSDVREGIAGAKGVGVVGADPKSDAALTRKTQDAVGNAGRSAVGGKQPFGSPSGTTGSKAAGVAASAIGLGAIAFDTEREADESMADGVGEAGAKAGRFGWSHSGGRAVRKGKDAVVGKAKASQAADSLKSAATPLQRAYQRLTRTRVVEAMAKAKQAAVATVRMAGPALGAAIGGAILLIAVIATLLVVIVGIEEESKKLEPFTDNERIVAAYLLAKGLDEVHVAAIMGNMYAESGINPGSIENGNAIGHGICQWSYGRWDGPGGLLEFATEQGKEWTDLTVQLDFFWTEFSGSWSGNYTITSGDDPAAGTRVRGSKNGFDATDDVTQAVKEFCYGWERPGIPHESTRISRAKYYLAILQGNGEGKDAVVAAAHTVAGYATPYVYGGNNIMTGCDCSYFTQWCYAQAGISIPRTDITQKNVGTVIPIEEAMPGDILWMDGHVGIYINPETVIEQTPPYCRVTSITYNQWVCAVRIDG